MTVGITVNGYVYRGTLYIANTAGTQIALSGLSNSTAYYYVQTNDLYYCNVANIHGMSSSGLDITLSIEVVRKAPNLLYLLIGVIVLLAGACTIPIAFLYKSKAC